MDRKTWAFALVSVAAVVEVQDGRLQDVRLCLSGVGNSPIRLTEVEALLKGQEPSMENMEKAAMLATEGFTPLSENGYKVELVQGMVKEALGRLLVSEN